MQSNRWTTICSQVNKLNKKNKYIKNTKIKNIYSKYRNICTQLMPTKIVLWQKYIRIFEFCWTLSATYNLINVDREEKWWFVLVLLQALLTLLWLWWISLLSILFLKYHLNLNALIISRDFFLNFCCCSTPC